VGVAGVAVGLVTVGVALMTQAARRLAESLMIDTGTITRGTGPGTVDPVTGDYTPGAATVVYAGACRVRKPTAVEQQVVFGDTSATVSRYLVNVPVDAPLFQIGDVFTLTTTDDGELRDRPMRVATVVGKSVLMYRQLGLEVVE
jgi:hypothetical protein